MSKTTIYLIASLVLGFSLILGTVFFLRPTPEPVTLPLRVEEYSDFSCPACKVYSETINKLEEQYKDKIVVTYRHYPLTELKGHERSYPAAVASEAAREQGKFKEFHNILFANQGKFTDEDFFQYAKDLGMDVEKFKKDYLENQTIKSRVDEDIKAGKEIPINGTPTFIINGKVANVSNPDSLAQKIDKMIISAK